MTHSPEPWTIERTNEVNFCIWDAAGEIVLNNHMDCEYFPHEMTPERIVACVNACRGIPTEELAKYPDGLDAVGLILLREYLPKRKIIIHNPIVEDSEQHTAFKVDP